MFEEVALRFEFGNKLAPGQLVSCDTSQDGVISGDSLAAVAQSQDKIIIYGSVLQAASRETSVHQETSGRGSSRDLLDFELDTLAPIGGGGGSVHFVVVRESVKTLAMSGLNLLIVGCSSCLLIYDTLSRTNLFRLNTQTAITAIASNWSLDQRNNEQPGDRSSRLIACGGEQKVCLLKLESTSFGNGDDNNNNSNYNAELASERSTGDTITCIVQGTTNGLELVLTGSRERKIRAYQIDLADENIQSVRFTIEESSQVNCLCPISSIETSGQHSNRLPDERSTTRGGHLPDTIEADIPLPSQQVEQMNHFAYGLEDESIGVYRLVASTGGQVKFNTERLWRHRCKHEPRLMLMHDINGDGLDELIIGFRSGRLEARAPLTGQLLATTRCFRLSSDRLAGLTVIDDRSAVDGSFGGKNRANNEQGEVGAVRGSTSMLLVCSTSGQLLGYRAAHFKPRVPLQVNASQRSSKQQQQQQLDFILGADLVQRQEDALKSKTIGTTRSGEPDDSQANVLMKQQQASGWEILASTQQTSEPTSGGGGADLHIELHGDDTKANRCEARQQVDLLQRMSSLYNEQMELETKLCRLYQRQVHQTSRFFSSSSSSPSSADVNLAHRWDFDATSICLKLTIVISARLELVDMIRLEDGSRNFLPAGFLLVNPGKLKSTTAEPKVGHKSHVLVVPLSPERNEPTTLLVQVFCDALTGGHQTSGSSSLVHVKRIKAPRFAMFAQEADIESLDLAKLSKKQKLEFDFKLNNQAQIFQARDWLAQNFLCLRFGRLEIDADGGNGNSTPPLFGPSQTNPPIGRLAALGNGDQLIADDDVVADSYADHDFESFELNLVDIRSLPKGLQGDDELDADAIRRLQVKLSDGHLRIECSSNIDANIDAYDASTTADIANSVAPSADLAMDLIQLLVIDRLQLKLERGEFTANVSPILLELDLLRGMSRQFEESERRIQSELYESADYTRNLMQQFAIANQLNEFSTAKELLNELSMLLSGAQNAAKTHSLNSSSRRELVKRANELEAKLSFLIGRSES